jgi:cbb3-type cytochrome oxidase subunit 1
MMERFVVGFIRASLTWFGVGVTLGVVMAFLPAHAMVYRPAHMHANLLGFVSMMIFGVAYHVVPRFSGAALHDRRMARVHLALANTGLALLVAAWIGRAWRPELSELPLRAGALLSSLGAALFIYNLWRTLDAGARAQAAMSRSRAAAQAGSLPVHSDSTTGGRS